MHRTTGGFLFVHVVCLGLGLAGASEPVDFSREVRPLLSDNCFPCHGPDRKARRARLRLDLETSVFDDRDAPIIVRGSPEESELYARITSPDPDFVMPPPESGKSLTLEEKDLIRRWIAAGAPYERAWSLLPPERPRLPQVALRTWPRTPIDHFILAELERHGLEPAPPAPRETLIRRVTLDLTGLAPTIAEIDAFLADASPEAYEKVVDRLLGSHRFGEHMAWGWLDAARYSDTNGYQGDSTRIMWPWRDWVIDAFNDNMPFDQFTIEQLAGDLLSEPTIGQQIATGFNRNHPLNGEGGRIAEESRVEYVVDRVETTTTVWMGLTAGCARCHDHKFDPISQKEFYRLYSYFNQVDESGAVDAGGNARPVLKVPVPAKIAALEKAEERIDELEALLRVEPTPREAEEQSAWEARLRENAPPVFSAWRFLGPIPIDDFDAGREASLGPEASGDDSTSVEGFEWQEKDWQDGRPITALPDERTVGYLYRRIVVSRATSVRLDLGADDAIRLFYNGEEILEKVTQAAPSLGQASATLELTPGTNHLLMKITNDGARGGFAFDWTHAGVAREIHEVIARPAEERAEDEDRRLLVYYRTSAADGPKSHAAVFRDLEALRQRAGRLRGEAFVDTMVMRERTEPRETYVLQLGRYDNPDTSELLSAGVPACLPPLEEAAGSRLGLARWLVSGEHPLVARVAVNRYWQALFGRGLVETSEDFGSQGAPPSHPALLDWLATEYVRLGWDRKALLRQIVTSATYAQSSEVTAELLRRDPYNRLLARGPRFRLPAHVLRDQALSVAGLLVEKIGGPPVRPYQPPGLWADFSFGKIRYQRDSGESLYRRSLYTFWRRSLSPPNMFDAADRKVCSVRPRRTNTPLHALTLLNDTTFVEAARALAERVLRESPTSAERLRLAFRTVTARRPDESEARILEDALARARAHYEARPDEARSLLAVGESTPDAELAATELAALTAVMSTLLNLDEVVTKE